MRRTQALPVLFSTALLAAVPARAVMPVGIDPEPPLGTFVASCEAVGDAEEGYLWTHGTGTALGVGQTFRLQRAATLDRVTFRLRQESQLAGEGAVLTLFRLGGPSWELLATQTGVLPFDLPLNEAVYVTLDPDDLSLDADTTYAFLLEIAGGGNVNASRGEILHVGGDLYPAGTAFQTGGAQLEYLDHDLEFFLQGTAQTAGDALLLRQDRFAVTATWRDFAGGTGEGVPVPLTDAAGYFWFFSSTNVELVVKVLDGCKEYDRYWVFAAGLTDVEVTLRVEDTEAGVTWEHVNPLHTPFPPILDSNALATCP